MVKILMPAYLYKEVLNTLYSKEINKDKYKYWICNSFIEYDIEINNDTWQNIQLVSVDNDNIIGYFSATINRQANHVTSLSVLNFYDSNIIFSKDFYKFINDLFIKYNFNKINFSVVVGNPAEKMYDKFIKKYNGKIVGIFEKDIKLIDNKLYDMKFYELFREDFLK